MKLTKKSFTLIEVTTAIVIIIILSAAGFFLAGEAMRKWRDSKRYADANNIAMALQWYFFQKKSYPDPSDKVRILDQSGTLIAYQWIVDSNVVDNWLNLTKIPVDPSDKNIHYSYIKAMNSWHEEQWYEIGTMIESYKDKDDGYKIYKWKYSTPYIISSNTITSCDQSDKLIFPTRLTVMNYDTNQFIRWESLWSWVDIIMDLQNIKGTCQWDSIAPIIWLSGGVSKLSTWSLTLLEVEDYPDIACDCWWIPHALECYKIYDGEKYWECHATKCETGYYLWWWYCVLGTGYLDVPAPYVNYWYKSIFVDSVWCDAKTSSLWWSNYKLKIQTSNACGEDTYIWVDGTARAWAWNNYWSSRLLIMWWPVEIGCSTQSRYCRRGLYRLPVEKIFLKAEPLSYAALHLFDFGSRQCWSITFNYDFYESLAWSEGGATYRTNNNKTTWWVVWTITIPWWNANVCKSTIPIWGERVTPISLSLIQSRINKTKTNNWLYSKLRATCQNFSQWEFASSEAIPKVYRPMYEFNYAGNIIQFTWDYTSSTLDMGAVHDYLNAKVDFYIPTWIDFDFYLRAWNSKTPWDSTWTDWYSFKDPNWVFHNERWISIFSKKRYFQYRLKYDTKTIWITPTYSYLRIYYKN